MAAIDISDKRTWRCLFKTPLIPALVVTIGGLIFGAIGAVTGVFGSLASGALLLVMSFVAAFVMAYGVGLLIVLVFGVLVRNLLPDRIPDIPVISWLNGSRWGRMILIFATLIVIGFVGISGMLFIYALMCLFEFSSDYDAVFGVEKRKRKDSQSAFY